MDPGKRRMCRESMGSGERGKVVCAERATFKRVQVVYYLCRNGQLEHPHYMEVTHLAHQHLRLKDVMDRLTVLRGKGMPSLYSWSCKRSYKNGYVWNDLVENDAIHPSEGAEYVLKGSELIQGCTDKLLHLQVSSHVPYPNFQPKGNSSASKRGPEHEEMGNSQFYKDHAEEGKAEAEAEYEACLKGNTRNSQCSRGVSTDEIEECKQNNTLRSSPNELNLDSNCFSSPPSTASSSLSDKANDTTTNVSKRFEDGDPVGIEPLLSRNSMLFSLIACGGSGSFRKSVSAVVSNKSPPPPSTTAARKSGSGTSLHKGVVCKAAAKAAEEEDDDMISYMPENPRFGNPQSEEKDYFSGSIVESITSEDRIGVETTLKKSSSYNEERSGKSGLEESREEEEKMENGMKGKCIPRKKSSSKHCKKRALMA